MSQQDTKPEVRCVRCGKTDNCQSFGIKPVKLCEGCVRLIVEEWFINFTDYQELAAS